MEKRWMQLFHMTTEPVGIFLGNTESQCDYDASPDQISALVAMLGSHNGEALNTLAPFGAACQSILYAVEQMDRECPKAIMGLFDISQRRPALANSLSLTMPFALWAALLQDLDRSCLTTHAWKEIEKRL